MRENRQVATPFFESFGIFNVTGSLLGVTPFSLADVIRFDLAGTDLSIGQTFDDPFVTQRRVFDLGEPHYVLFVNANLPFFADAQFDRSHFDYANFV